MIIHCLTRLHINWKEDMKNATKIPACEKTFRRGRKRPKNSHARRIPCSHQFHCLCYSWCFSVLPPSPYSFHFIIISVANDLFPFLPPLIALSAHSQHIPASFSLISCLNPSIIDVLPTSHLSLHTPLPPSSFHLCTRAAAEMRLGCD